MADLRWLIETELGRGRRRCSSATRRRWARRPRPRALLRGGAEPEAVGEAVRRTGARVVHAHNLHPAWGWRALAAARPRALAPSCTCTTTAWSAPTGSASPAGADCTRCHGRWTAAGRRPQLPRWLPRRGVGLRGGARAAAAAARRARRRHRRPERLRARAPARAGRAGATDAVVIPSVQRTFAPASRAARRRVRPLRGPRRRGEGRVRRDRRLCCGRPAAGDRGRRAGARRRPRPRRRRPWPPRRRTSSPRLRARAAVAIVPSRYEEILPLAALEAMAAGLPVVATRSGGLAEIVPEEGLDRSRRPRRPPARPLAGRCRRRTRAGARPRTLRARRRRPPTARRLRRRQFVRITVTRVTNCAAARPKALWTIRS